MGGLSTFDRAVLHVLCFSRTGLYGSDFVERMPDFWFVRARIYTSLERLVEAGFVQEKEEAVSRTLGLARTRHFITTAGRKEATNG